MKIWCSGWILRIENDEFHPKWFGLRLFMQRLSVFVCVRVQLICDVVKYPNSMELTKYITGSVFTVALLNLLLNNWKFYWKQEKKKWNKKNKKMKSLNSYIFSQNCINFFIKMYRFAIIQSMDKLCWVLLS